MSCSNVLKTGYLKKDLQILNAHGKKGVTLFFGSYIDNGQVTVWADENGTLYREPEKDLKYGKVYDLSLLEFSETSAKGLKKAVIKPDVSLSMISSDLKEVIFDAEDLYYTHCSTCHMAPDPTKKYNAQLKAVMYSMVSHANITKEQASLLSRFVSLSSSH